MFKSAFKEMCRRCSIRSVALMTFIIAVAVMSAALFLLAIFKPVPLPLGPASNAAHPAVAEQDVNAAPPAGTKPAINAAPPGQAYDDLKAETVRLKAADLKIKWFDWPWPVAAAMSDGVFASLPESAYSGLFAEYSSAAVSANGHNYSDIQQRLSERLRLYAVGRGAADSQSLVYVLSYDWQEGPGGPAHYLVLSRPGSKPVVLSAYSDWLDSRLYQLFAVDEQAQIQGLNLPERVASPDGHGVLIQRKNESYMAGGLLVEQKPADKMFSAGRLAVYLTHSCFYAVTPDGVAHYYDLDLSAINGDAATRTAVPAIVFTDGQVNAATYQTKGGGTCSQDCYGLVEPDLKELRLVGQTASGEKFYELAADGQSDLAKGVAGAYDGYSQYYDAVNDKTKPKLSLAEFRAQHPLLLWQDSFGDWLAWNRIDLQPAAECGKPVIYLYPEKETTATVRVAPTGGLTRTEPAYGDGWRVLARPDGRLTDLVGGQDWPYLFWEGLALNYSRPGEGFMVRREEVDAFLVRSLAAQGLNAKESADFREFWAPKLQEKPWYFITFVPQVEFDRLAPLAVTPQPDTVIRVFMDYQGLEVPVSVRPQKLAAPERRGFTVVEWGGQLRH